MGFKAVQKLLRDMVEGHADGCVGQLREREPGVAEPGELRIEKSPPEITINFFR